MKKLLIALVFIVVLVQTAVSQVVYAAPPKAAISYPVGLDPNNKWQYLRVDGNGNLRTLAIGAFNNRGAWSSGTIYAKQDTASYNGTSYISLTSSNIGNTPSTSPAFWQVMVTPDWANPGAIGLTTPNTVATTGLSLFPTSTSGNTNFGSLRYSIQQSTGEIDADFYKTDGTKNYGFWSIYPYYSFPFQNTGWWDVRIPVTFFEISGGIVALGRYNGFQLVDPSTGACTVTHTGGTGSGANYRLYFVDSNSGMSKPSPSCTDATGFTYAELAAGGGVKKNIVHYNQPGGYSNMLPARDGNALVVVNDPGHSSAGVLSTLTSCLVSTGCDWTDDGSWGNINVDTLVGAFYQPNRNTTSSMVVPGRFWGQGGMSVSGGVGFKGYTFIGNLDDPSAPTVTKHGTGSTSYTYYVVYHDWAGGTSNVSPGTTVINAPSTPNNDITYTCYPNYQSADVLKNGTTQALATNAPCEGNNSPTGNPSTYTITDTGQATTAYSAPSRNSTGDVNITGNVIVNQSLTAQHLFGGLDITSNLMFSWDSTSGHGYVVSASGDATHDGYLAWYIPANTRAWTLGFDAGSTPDLTLTPAPGVGSNFVVASPLRITPVTYSQLPTCNAGAEGAIRSINDSTTLTWGAVISGGGSSHVLAYCNGVSGWTVMGY